jgi:hypothetical protein
MPLRNPYNHKIDSADETGVKLQCDIDPNDKALLVGLRPAKGTIQLIVINLLHTLCNDLRDLGITSYRPDADDVIATLVESRPFSPEQLARVRQSLVGTHGQIPERFLVDRGGTGVREKTAGAKTKSGHAKERTSSRVERNRKEGRQAPAESV